MPVEIERKFLVRSDEWRKLATGSQRLRDGILARFGDGKVRVRIADDRAWLTVKGPRTGLRRLEFEYEIARPDAEEMLRTLGNGPVLRRPATLFPMASSRGRLTSMRGRWKVVILTEIELEHEDQAFTVPAWVGREVTGDPRYKKANLFRPACRPAEVLGGRTSDRRRRAATSDVLMMTAHESHASAMKSQNHATEEPLRGSSVSCPAYARSTNPGPSHAR